MRNMSFLLKIFVISLRITIAFPGSAKTGGSKDKPGSKGTKDRSKKKSQKNSEQLEASGDDSVEDITPPPRRSRGEKEKNGDRTSDDQSPPPKKKSKRSRAQSGKNKRSKKRRKTVSSSDSSSVTASDSSASSPETTDSDSSSSVDSNQKINRKSKKTASKSDNWKRLNKRWPMDSRPEELLDKAYVNSLTVEGLTQLVSFYFETDKLKRKVNVETLSKDKKPKKKRFKAKTDDCKKNLHPARQGYLIKPPLNLKKNILFGVFYSKYGD